MEMNDCDSKMADEMSMAKTVNRRSRKLTESRSRVSGQRRNRRRYQPDVESLEAIQVLNASVPGLPDLATASEQLYLPEPTWSEDRFHGLLDSDEADSSNSDSSLFAAWDAAIADEADQRATEGNALADAFTESLSQVGYHRMERYLNRAWQKAGIAPPQDEDCTQSVYMVLLEKWGRDQFENLATTVGRNGLTTLIRRESPAGLDFLRALDQIKKQTQRQMSRKTFLMEDSASGSIQRQAQPDQEAIGRDLEQKIQDSLKPREAELIRSTIEGDTPSEIAARWGVSSKTVSNVKSEVIQKLRVTLAESIDSDFLGQP
jgi:RNA polymerase sigma factor (sigma-70 family)